MFPILLLPTAPFMSWSDVARLAALATESEPTP